MWSALDTIFKQKFSVDLFEFSDMKYIDSKLSLIKYMHCYLANMEFCFVSIKWLLFGFCSNQCLTSVVKFSKTHTMVVHFSGRTRPKRKKTENTTTLELWSLLPESSTGSSIFLLAFFFFFFFFYVEFFFPPTEIAHIIGYFTEQTLILSQNDRWCLFDITSFRSLICFNFCLPIIISFSFLQRSLQILLIVWDAIVMVGCIVCFEYFKYCLCIIITRESFHQKQILFSKLMSEWCNFLVTFFNFLFLLVCFLFRWCFNPSSQFFTFYFTAK